MAGSPIYDVAIIGGGASGLAAALSAGRTGQSVVLIERDVEVGLPILATGNGRCNLSNADLDPARYRHPDIARTVMGGHPEEELARLFDSIGLLTCEIEGRLYPHSKRADTVRDALVAAVAKLGVDIRCCAEVERVEHDDADGWQLELSVPADPLPTPKKPPADFRAHLRGLRKELKRAPRTGERVSARRVIIACGGASADVAGLFGLPHIEEMPVLCPVACTPQPDITALSHLDGLRVDCRLSLMHGNARCWSEEGEVLFRPYGISGIVAFDLSRRVKASDVIELDLFPSFSEEELIELFDRRCDVAGMPETVGPAWFCGMLAPALAAHVDAVSEHAGGRGVRAYAHACKHLAFTAAGTTEHASAQVRRGGIPFDAVDLPDLSVKPSCAPALSVCGEALDMDADCGGFNLAWAWLSGLRAGAVRP